VKEEPLVAPTNAVYGYTDRMSYAAGDLVRVHANADAPTVVEVDLVDITDGETTEVPWSGAGRYEALPQSHCVGSFAVIEDGLPASADAFALGTWLWPTTPDGSGVQTLLAVESTDGRALALEVEDGDVVLSSHGPHGRSVMARAGVSLLPRTWYFAAAQAVDGRVAVTVAAVAPGAEPVSGSAEPADAVELAAGARISLAGAHVARVERAGSAVRGTADDLFNGKLEAPFVIAGGLSEAELAAAASGDTSVVTSDAARVLGAWDLAPSGPGNDVAVRGIGGAPDGLLVNLPARGVTGVSWTGAVASFLHAPREYAAAHFHEDDLSDVGWSSLLEAGLPPDVGSGLYGIRLRCGEHTDVIPITVVPSASSSAPILVVLPTFTYLAYANEHMFEGDVSGLRPDVQLDPRDAIRVGKPEYGLSQYDRHSDDGGVLFSSSARAILTMRADYEMWLTESGRGYCGDMYLLRWLRAEGLPFDVVTDLEVHQQGRQLLSRYAVVVTGAHPEYTSAEMQDALRAYRDSGGNVMYLGGNGFYQATGVVSEYPLITEIRRGHAGVRGWDSAPGEVTLVSSGEPGGPWRHRGQAPQGLVGVGFCAQGWDRSSPYRRSAESEGPDVSWIFEGVEGDDIGAVGLVRGGAAGDEIDRADVALGTPPSTVVLASSYGHSDAYQRAIEELGMNLPGLGGGTTDPEVRADMTYTPVRGGGAVFSVGSIAWTGSLAGDSPDPGVVAITRNVLRRFAAGPRDA
jgi:N,N-dimethylformamidase